MVGLNAAVARLRRTGVLRPTVTEHQLTQLEITETEIVRHASRWKCKTPHFSTPPHGSFVQLFPPRIFTLAHFSSPYFQSPINSTDRLLGTAHISDTPH